jgi:thiamine biosynthesis lipoprotein
MELRSHPFRAMGSPCELRLYAGSGERADAAAAAARAEVLRLERKFTRYRDDSLTARINRSAGDPAGVEVDEETAGLLDYAATAFAQSGGLFDVTSGVLRRAWDFRSGRVPTAEEVEAVLRLVGFEKLRWRRPRLALPLAGMELDFGGYVKEYAADRAALVCRAHGIAHGFVDLGGDLAVIGPHPDGQPWQVGVRHPRRAGEAIATLALSGGAVASSGDYERCLVVGGKRYGHILSPRTGWPVEGLAGVSVVADRCLVAGTASTVAMLKGAAGPAWLAALDLPHLCISPDGALAGTLAPAPASGHRAEGPGSPLRSPSARCAPSGLAHPPPAPRGTTASSGVQPAAWTGTAAAAASARLANPVR